MGKSVISIALLFLILAISGIQHSTESIILSPTQNAHSKMPMPLLPSTAENTNNKGIYRQIGAIFTRKLVMEKIKQQQQQKDFNWRELICKECALAVKYLYDYVSNPDLQNQIQDFVDQFICQKMGPYKAMCDKVVNAEIPFLFEELQAVLGNSKVFCQQIHLCPVNGGGVQLLASSFAAANNNGNDDIYQQIGFLYAQKIAAKTLMSYGNGLKSEGVVCKECQMAIHAVYEYVSKPEVQQKVLEFVEEMVCSNLGLYKSMCKRIVKAEMPMFWKKLENELEDNKAFCGQIHLCPADEKSIKNQDSKMEVKQPIN